MRSLKFLTLVLALTLGSTAAYAQCYAFAGPGVSYTMNVQSVTSYTNNPSFVASFIVQQLSVLVYGGKTYTATAGPANLIFSVAAGGSASNDTTSFTTSFIDVVDQPLWAAQVFLIGNPLDLLPTSPPASLPGISAWNLGTPHISISISGGAVININLTAVGSCSGSTGGGTTSTVDLAKSLGDSTTQPGCITCGFPISVGTGNMFEQADDYQTTGANRLRFSRYYNSMASATTFATSLGKNWRSNYDRYLNISASSVIAERPDGQQITFTSSGGAWTADTDVDLALTNSGSTWILTDHHDTVETYSTLSSTEALLGTVKARNGYLQTLQYNSSNQLTSVTDSFNRQLTFAYNNGLLQAVTTPDGLVLTYAYASNILTSVSYSTTPATSKTYCMKTPLCPPLSLASWTKTAPVT